MQPCTISPPGAVSPAPAQPDLTCTVVTAADRLEGLRDPWLALLGRSASNEPMLTPTWLLTWWRVYGQGTGRQPRVVLFHEGERLVGLAPLLRRRYWYRPGIPFLRLEPLGSDVDEGDGVCSVRWNVIAERGSERRVVEALVRAVTSGALGAWHELVLPAMDGEGVMPTLLVEAFRRAGLHAEQAETGQGLYIPLPASWEAYLKSLLRTRRYYVKRTLREFDAWAAGTARVHQVRTAAELEEGERILRSLHGERWGEEGQPGAFRSPRFAAFHAAVMREFLAGGALELLWMTVRGEPVAAMYSFVWDGKVQYYQCGRKLGAPQRARPGIALQAMAIRMAIEAGRREFDYLVGVARYKIQFALASRPLVQLRVARPTLREHARRWARRGINLTRGVQKGLLSAVRWVTRSGRGEQSSPPDNEDDATQ